MLKTLLLIFFICSLITSPVQAGSYKAGLEAFRANNYELAYDNLYPLAHKGNRSAQYFLGAIFDDSKNALHDTKKAIHWYTKAAKQGEVNAQFSLGAMYHQGEGVLQNDKEAFYWYSKAAKQGDSESQMQLARFYILGIATEKDYALAYMWLNLSRYNGNNKTQKAFDIIIAVMIPSYIIKAQEMSRTCLNSNYQDCKK